MVYLRARSLGAGVDDELARHWAGVDVEPERVEVPLAGLLRQPERAVVQQDRHRQHLPPGRALVEVLDGVVVRLRPEAEHRLPRLVDPEQAPLPLESLIDL